MLSSKNKEEAENVPASSYKYDFMCRAVVLLLNFTPRHGGALVQQNIISCQTKRFKTQL